MKKKRTDKETQKRAKASPAKKKTIPKKPRKTAESGKDSSKNPPPDKYSVKCSNVNHCAQCNPDVERIILKFWFLFFLSPCSCHGFAGLSDDGSDYEPQINVVKKKRTNKQTQRKAKASPVKKNTTLKKSRKTPESGKDPNKNPSPGKYSVKCTHVTNFSTLTCIYVSLFIFRVVKHQFR